jgi:hypothetical protein
MEYSKSFVQSFINKCFLKTEKLYRPGSISYSPFQSRMIDLHQRLEFEPPPSQPPHLLRPSEILGTVDA